MAHRKGTRRSRKKAIKGKPETVDRKDFESLEMEQRIALIQELIPIGLMAVAEELNREVEDLVGARHQRTQSSFKRHGYNPGTVRLGGRLVHIRVPRVRGDDGEISLRSYELLHGHSELEEESIFQKVAKGISSRSMEDILPESASAIGASKSSVSRKVVSATAKILKEFHQRDLSGDSIIAIFMDGTSFANDQMVIALGITDAGEKKILGFVQTATENAKPLTEFLRSLQGRGLRIPYGLLAVIDGSKGLKKAFKDVFGSKVLIQRCQWHKRENVASYLAKGEQAAMKQRLSKAYNKPLLKDAKADLEAIAEELETRNLSAHKSLLEGLDETLTLHSMGVFPKVGISFKTTNCIESLNSMAKDYTRRVKVWRTSDQKQRWLAAALQEVEPRLMRVRGYRNLESLIRALPGKQSSENRDES